MHDIDANLNFSNAYAASALITGFLLPHRLPSLTMLRKHGSSGTSDTWDVRYGMTCFIVVPGACPSALSGLEHGVSPGVQAMCLNFNAMQMHVCQLCHGMPAP
jgi:hypothetical protein